MSNTTPAGSGAGDHQRPTAPDPYEVLQVDPHASREVIAEAYWILVRKAQSLGSHDQAAEALQRLNAAYAALIDRDQRLSLVQTPELGVPPDGAPRSPAGARDRRRRHRDRMRKSRSLPAAPKSRSLYQVLQVHPNADHAVIAAAYSYLREQHRDSVWVGRADPEALKELTEAFQVLVDPERRARYDAAVLGHREPQPSPTTAPPSAAGSLGLTPPPPVTGGAEATPAGPAAKTGAVRLAAAKIVAIILSVDWWRLLRVLVRFLGRSLWRLLVVAGLGARYAGRRLYRGIRWFLAAVVAPAGRRLGAAGAHAISALRSRLRRRPPPAGRGRRAG